MRLPLFSLPVAGRQAAPLIRDAVVPTAVIATRYVLVLLATVQRRGGRNDPASARRSGQRDVAESLRDFSHPHQPTRKRSAVLQEMKYAA
jgi:hypothetical protein